MYWTVNLQGVTGFNGPSNLTLDLLLTPSALSTARNALPTLPILPKTSTTRIVLMQRNYTRFDVKGRERIRSSSSKLQTTLTTMALSENFTNSPNTSIISTPIDHDSGFWKDNPYARRGLNKMKEREKMGHWGRRLFHWWRRNSTKNFNCTTTVHYSHTERTEVMSKVETALVFGLSLALVPIIVVLLCGLNSVFKSIKLRAKKIKRKIMPGPERM